ncbi:MAG: hypothetical protein J5598_03085 [Clostridia bacterium]|nr:hypothetical protein [Clostridia bacterium]
MTEIMPVRNIFEEIALQLKVRGQSTDLATPWFLDLKRRDFVWLKLMALMQKIMTDCYRFSTSIDNKDKELSLFDSVVYKKANYGLISWISYLIATQGNEYLVYDNGIIRKATIDERKKIDEAYKKGTDKKPGVIVDFSNYALGKLLRHYFHQLYTVEDSNEKSIALGGSLQLKFAELRKNIGVNEGQSKTIRGQATEICIAAKNGKPFVLDAGDTFEQTDVSKNTDLTTAARDKIYQEIAALLGCLPSYICGIDEKTNGSGSSYERLDGRNEDMIKNFWITIFEPIVTELLNVKIDFVSQKWEQIKNNLGSISMIEGLATIPNNVKASVIAKLIGPDNAVEVESDLEKAILQALEEKAKQDEENRKLFANASTDDEE